MSFCVPVHWVHAPTKCGLARNTWELMRTSTNHCGCCGLGHEGSSDVSEEPGAPRVWRFRLRIPSKVLGSSPPATCRLERASSSATRSIRIAVRIDVGVSARHTLICSLYDLTLIEVDREFQFFSCLHLRPNIKQSLETCRVSSLVLSQLPTCQPSILFVSLVITILVVCSMCDVFGSKVRAVCTES